MKTKALLSVATAAMLILSGCSDGANGSDAIVNVGEAVLDADIGAEIGEQGFNSEVKDGVVILDTVGSSSCPPTIASGTYADGVLTLTAHIYTDQACTLDQRPFRQEISLADGKKFDTDVTINLIRE